ncbi:jun coactivator Jab1 [Rhizoctonia solani AG-1 IA]|uniref:COP9 signalosome complex subunit 5 n=1 Tax=Thanatephorus cucumeris (strain AG1-IA) TaxID=983506 RepID=L8WHY1_THACA|nr:jun coactivator Jab1 [Rhizoctonia solani AG-1 IA]
MNSDTDTAFKTFSLANDVREIDAADEILVYDKAEAVRIDKEAPWKKDPHYFKKVYISVIALIKMVIHARSGGIYEIMGMMQGKVRASDRSLVVMDSFALMGKRRGGDVDLGVASIMGESGGTETRVNAANEANEYMVAFQQGSERAGRLENAIGWYHSHPGYGCWLSGIDVDTQSTNQKFQDPFVIDPNRTISAGKVDIGAFRTFPADYKPPASEVAEYQSIPLSKIEDFGVHANIEAKSRNECTNLGHRLDNELLGRLWNKYWVNTLSQSPLISNRAYAVSQLTDLGAKLAKAQGSLTQRGAAAGNAALAGIPEEVLGGRKGKAKSGEEDKGLGYLHFSDVGRSTKIAREAQHGLIAQVLKDIVFGTRPGEETQTGGIEARVAGVVGGAM